MSDCSCGRFFAPINCPSGNGTDFLIKISDSLFLVNAWIGLVKAHRAFRNGGSTYYLSEGGQAMVSEEELEYRRSCPYDAMGDYSGLSQYLKGKDEPDEKPKDDTG